ncbi:D-alanyl-D-alanine carboxypeptidase family protein [Thalassobacillus sp. CUG 92003]|uniref:D-alanyl-D-alanine carboxypeptidase family protein n=1 Tax=Thalassobacillus sp. CUG 92003 TaxID=2736641 RepID=UPI0015E6A540|nr:D-alanyl-D-alanine carboxypeptidase family protein [Thalassobacillus sp. CUG 92003]
MRTWIVLLTVVVGSMATIGSVSAKENAEEIQLTESAESAILIEKNSGQILYQKEADKKLPPASMTKVMTLLLIMEALDEEKIKLDEIVRVSEHAASMGGSQIFLEAGEEMSVKNLLKGVAVASGNDASVALAERIAGNEEQFVEMMNNKVAELGLENTHFVNPTGLPADNHYSTSHDMAIMAQELLKHEEITEYTKIYDDYLRKGQKNEFWLVNTNKLMKSYPGMDGLKTGFTSEAKYCLTATAKRDGMRLITVVMGAKTPKERNADVASMLDYAFQQYDTQILHKQDKPLSVKRMDRGKPVTLNVVPKSDVTVLKRKGSKDDTYELQLKLDHTDELPVSEGDKQGNLMVMKNGKKLSEMEVVAGNTVNQADFWTLWQRSWKYMTTFENF